jgi:hypothetical protein
MSVRELAKRDQRRQLALRRPEPAVLPSRHQAIIKHVFLARYMTNRMIADLVYRPTTFSSCKQDLRDLFDWGYLRKRQSAFNYKDVYFLGLKGKRFIAGLGEYSKYTVDKVAGVSGGLEPPLEHDLTLARIYTAAVKQCRRHHYRLSWMNTRMLELAQLGVQPDAHIHVAGAIGVQEAFVEYTDVVPHFEALTHRLRAYRALWEREHPIPILWFAATRAKLEQLAQVVHSYIYRDYIAVASIQDVNCFITGKVWWDCEKGELANWITPDEQILHQAPEAGFAEASADDSRC